MPEVGLRTIHEFAVDEEGTFVVDGIPAGDLWLQRDGGRGWETLAKPQLVAGQTLSIE